MRDCATHHCPAVVDRAPAWSYAFRIGARRAVELAVGASLVVAPLAPVHAEIYRCSVDGKTVYSDQPCGTSPIVVDVAPSAPPPTSPAVAPNLQYEAGMGRVVVGQTTAQVEQAWGRPQAINSDVRANGLREQWVYRRDSQTVYVSIENGRVSGISSRGRVPSKPAAMRGSRADRDAQERAAKAGERKHVTVGMRLNRTDVRERLGEPDRRSSAGGMDVWTYLPADHDYQTRTVIKFRRDGTVFDIERVVQR